MEFRKQNSGFPCVVFCGVGKGNACFKGCGKQSFPFHQLIVKGIRYVMEILQSLTALQKEIGNTLTGVLKIQNTLVKKILKYTLEICGLLDFK